MMNARFDLHSGDGGLKRNLIFAGAALLVTVIVIAAVANIYSGLDASNIEARAQARQMVANGIAQELGVVLEPYRLKLAALAKDSRIVRALRENNKEMLAALATTAQADFSGAQRLRLLVPGIEEIDNTGFPPLTYASLDMLRKARDAGSRVGAELHLGGTPQEHIVLIERVVEDGELVGFLHLSLAPSLIRDALTRNPPPDVQIEIRQPVRNSPPTIVAKYGDAPPADALATIAGVAGTRWVVALRSSLGSVEQGGRSGTLRLAGLALVLVVIAIGVQMIIRRRTKRDSVEDSVVYQGAIKAIMEGALPGLEQLLPGVADGKSVSSDVKPLSSGAQGEDITRFRAPDEAASAEDPTLPGAAEDGTVEPREGDGLSDLTETPTDETRVVIPASIFRSYDIRGIVGDTLTEDGVYHIGRAIGAQAQACGQQTMVVARDGRKSSPALRDALVSGLRESGRDVLDIGLTPTPVLYFATHYLDTHSGVMVTGSHNPPDYNGLKIVIDGQTLSGDAIQALKTRIDKGDYSSGEGSLQSTEIIPDYIRRVSEEIPVSLGDVLKVVVDCGNGVPGIVAPHILRAIGHDVIELYCDIDPDFPNHHPDPSQPENLKDLIDMVREEGADLGLAFDGDGDRLGVVDGTGKIIWPDQQMMLFAQDILSRNPGAKIIYDVKCSRLLADVISTNGGEPIMWRTGHSPIKTKMQETGALLAGEMSGHIFFKERWYGFDDALYSAARLLEILVNAKGPPEDVFAQLPAAVSTPELRVDMPEARHGEFMRQVMEAADFEDGEVITIDGLRVDFPDCWGLVRPSNTTPCLVLRFEGNDEPALEKITERFRNLLLKVDPTLELPF